MCRLCPRTRAARARGVGPGRGVPSRRPGWARRARTVQLALRAGSGWTGVAARARRGRGWAHLFARPPPNLQDVHGEAERHLPRGLGVIVSLRMHVVLRPDRLVVAPSGPLKRALHAPAEADGAARAARLLRRPDPVDLAREELRHIVHVRCLREARPLFALEDVVDGAHGRVEQVRLGRGERPTPRVHEHVGLDD